MVLASARVEPAPSGRWRRGGNGTFPHTVPFALEASETFDVGSDTGTGVNDADYQTPFAFDGKLNKLTLKLLTAG